MQSFITDLDLPLRLKSHLVQDLVIESSCLKENPLGDTARRHNYILLPKKPKGPLPVVFHLSGYFSTGFQNFHSKTLELNFVEEIDQLIVKGRVPQALHVFVEANTYWGGSQFLNSPGCGDYTDYILKEIYSAVIAHYDCDGRACVMGGSSGGYGALHLISQKKSPFQIAFAVAPDSFFEASLLPELHKMAPSFLKFSASLKSVRKAVEEGELQSKKSFFSLMHGLAMGLCYSPASSLKDDSIEFPIDLETGLVEKKIWTHWLQQDPVCFLRKRAQLLEGKTIFLEVGAYDNFSLQFGARQIRDVLKQIKVKHNYLEFAGDHFALRERRLGFLQSLLKIWK